MQLGVDVRPRRRSEAEQVVWEVVDDERVAGRGAGTTPEQERVRPGDRTPEQCQRVRALLVDIGRHEIGEIGEQLLERGIDDGNQLTIVGGELQPAAVRCRNRRPLQPSGSNASRRVEQHPRRIGCPEVGLHLRRHTNSSIVTDVRTPHPSGRRWTKIVVLAVAASAAACTGVDNGEVGPSTSVAATTTTVAKRASDGRLVIGAYLPQTGPGASLGEPMIAAVRSAVAHINAEGGVLGQDVELLVLDEGTPSGPSALLAEGVDAIVGPASSRNALSKLASIVRPDTGVVTCSPTATALALDDFPDNGYFFRTAPSDSLQMIAIARRAERTGVPTVAVGFLDDPYGRGLVDALVSEIEQRRRQDVVAKVAFGADQEDLSPTVSELLADDPGLVIVLGDADDGGRLLSALDAATPDDDAQVIANDAIRTAAAISQLSPDFRSRLTSVAPLAESESTETSGYFTGHAVDCVNLIALATVEAGSDDPAAIRLWMAPVSGGGRQCTSFEDCVGVIEQGLQIDYNGLSGAIEISSTTGDTTRASFVQFGFDADGAEVERRVFEAP